MNRPLRTFVFAGMMALVTAPAAIAGGASFAVRPVTFRPSVPATQSYFIFDAAPGRTIRSEVRVTNAGTATGSALLYPVDAVTGQTSGAVYLSRTARRRDVGRWTRLDVTKVTLAPQKSTVIRFTVTVPASVSPGSHLGGIVAENLAIDATKKKRARNSFQIRVRHLSIVALEVNLPGAQVEQLGLGTVTAGSTGSFPTAQLALRNAGTLILKPSGKIRIATMGGRAIEQQQLHLDTFIPRTAIDYPVVLPKRLRAGRYRAEVTLGYGHGRLLRATRTLNISDAQAQHWLAGSAPAAASSSADSGGIGVVPWIVTAVAIGFAVGGIALALRSRRRRGATTES